MQCGRMDQPNVVIVAYPGMQSLDAVGPFEVFAGATRAAAATGRWWLQVLLASTDGAPVQAESGVGLGTAPLPGPDRPIDTLVIPGGGQARRRVPTGP